MCGEIEYTMRVQGVSFIIILSVVSPQYNILSHKVVH